MDNIDLFWPRAFLVLASAAMAVLLIVLTCQTPPARSVEEENDRSPWRRWAEALKRWSGRLREGASSSQVSKPGPVAERAHL